MSKIEQVYDKAVAVLGSEDAAVDWMDHTSATLGGTPRLVAESEEGFKKVMLHLAGISRHSLD